jgi:hypothetical protein
MNLFLPKRRLVYISSAAIILLLISTQSFGQLGWTEVPTPNPSPTRNMVRGISGTSSADVWAVGSYEETLAGPPYNVQNDLLLHWNGNSWQQSPALHLSTTLDDLFDVEAISTNNLWAVGNYNDVSTRAEILHYDGTTWTNYPVPFIPGGSYLYGITAISATDIWAGGGRVGSPTRPAYTMHYNGSSWTEVAVPIVGSYRNAFNDIHGIASNDVWAGGHYGNSSGDYRALMMHWNGSAWVNVPLPASITAQLGEVLTLKMVAANDVWAQGYYHAGGGFEIHWNGSTWTEVIPANNAGGAYAVLSSNNIYAVGDEIDHWDGAAWSQADALAQINYPSLGSAVVFPNGEIWAGGNKFDASFHFLPLIVRSVNHVPQFTGGTTQSWNVGMNSSNNSLANLLLTTDADVSQILTYTLISAPTHGSVSGLPTTAITSSSYALPSGVTYTPAPGYTGLDQFVVEVAVGSISSQTTIDVLVGGPLPVTLTSFNVTRNGSNAVLQWSTASEANTQYFDVQHSTDGINFTSISNVAAQGNSNTMHAYTFTHQLPSPGINYYRLKLVDMDGRATLFPVKSVLFETAYFSKVVLLSNPVSNNSIVLQVNATGTYNATLHSMQGQKIFEQHFNATGAGNRHTIPIPNAAPGIYILVVNDQKERYTFKLIVQ